MLVIGCSTHYTFSVPIMIHKTVSCRHFCLIILEPLTIELSILRVGVIRSTSHILSDCAGAAACLPRHLGFRSALPS
jgi:hypothetical protein